MLHLQTEIKRNSNYCIVEYDNPNQDITKGYTLKFHSVYSKPNEHNNINVPLIISVQDSPYVSFFEYKDFKEKKIKDVCKEIKENINSNTNRYATYLKKFIHQKPAVIYNRNSRDDNSATRFFEIKLPKNTYLFSSYKPVLNALGYADDQLEYVENIETKGIPKNVIVSSQAKVSNNITSIWIVKNNLNESVYPVRAKQGHLKWKNDDLFNQVFFTSVKNERYVHPTWSRRVRRTLTTPSMLPKEQDVNVVASDTLVVQKQKIRRKQKWERRAELMQVVSTDVFDWSAIRGNAQTRNAQAKLNYWRAALVRSLSFSSSLTDPVILSVPEGYFNIQEKNNFIEPMTFLLEDHKSYIQLGASKAISEFLKQYKIIYEGVLQTEITETEKIKYREEIRSTTEAIQNIITKQAEKSQKFRQSNENSLKSLENAIREQSALAASEESGEGVDANPPNLPSSGPPDGNEGGANLLPTANGEGGSMEISEGEAPPSLSPQQPPQKKPKLTREEEERFRAARNEMNTYLIAAEEAKNALDTNTNMIETTINGNVTVISFNVDSAKNQIVTNTQLIQTQGRQIKAAYDIAVAALKVDTNEGKIATANQITSIQTHLDEIISLIDGVRIQKKNITDGLIDLSLNKTNFQTLTDKCDTEETNFEEAKLSASRIKDAFPEQWNTINNTYQVEVDNNIDIIEKTKKLLNDTTDTIDQIIPSFTTTDATIQALLANAKNFQTQITNAYNEKYGTETRNDSGEEEEDSDEDEEQENEEDDGDLLSIHDELVAGGEEDLGLLVNDDERISQNLTEYDSCSVGVIHFPSDKLMTDDYMINNIKKETTAKNVADALNTVLTKVLKNKFNLAIDIKVEVVKNATNANDNEKIYAISNNNLNTDSSAYVILNFNESKYGYFLRLTDAALSSCEIKMSVNDNFKIYSDNFTAINPFEDSFNRNLPLIATPVNAGLTNSFFTNIGPTASLGIIEESGKVKDAVTIYMRPAKKERFYIYFYTTNLENMNFTTPCMLYLHFIVEPFFV